MKNKLNIGFNKPFTNLFAIIIAILPLLSPGLGGNSLAVEPETYKTAIAVGASGIMLLLWLLANNINSGISIVKTSFYIPITLFILFNIVSLTWVIDIEAGILATLQYATMAIGFFLALDLVYKQDNFAKKLLIMLVISGALVAILGLLQYYFPDNIGIQNFSRQAVRPASSFGNKNMSSQLLIMVLPISIVLLWREKILKYVLLFTATTTTMLWFLTYTYTRAGWVSFFVEMLFLLAFVIANHMKNKNTQEKAINTKDKEFKKQKLIIIAIGVIIYFIGVNYTDTGFNSNNTIINKAVSITNGDSSGRLPAWANTLNMIKDNPVFGVGSGNWQAHYPIYYDTILPDAIFNERIRLRRLHNTYLEMIANVGIVGMALLLWLVFLTIKASSKILLNPDNPNRYLILGISLSLIGFSVSAIFSFPLRVFLPGLLVMVYIGIIAGLYSKELHNNHNINSYYTSSSLFAKLMLIPIVMLAIMLVSASYKWIWAKHHYQKSIEYSFAASKHPKAHKISLKHALESANLNPYKPQSFALIGDLIKKINTQEAVKYSQKSLQLSPNNSLVLLSLANSYYAIFIKKYKQGDTKAANEAKKSYLETLQRILTLDNKNVRAYALLTRYYLIENDITKAQEAYNNAKKWQKYFLGRSGFGPYDGIVNAIGNLLTSHLNKK